MDIQEPIKKISISGTHNKYEMKKILNKDEENNKEPKKRIVTKNWSFSDEYFDYKNQLQIVTDILNNSINYSKTKKKK